MSATPDTGLTVFIHSTVARVGSSIVEQLAYHIDVPHVCMVLRCLAMQNIARHVVTFQRMTRNMCMCVRVVLVRS